MTVTSGDFKNVHAFSLPSLNSHNIERIRYIENPKEEPKNSKFSLNKKVSLKPQMRNSTEIAH